MRETHNTDQVSINDLLCVIGQKEATILLLSRKITALIAENQTLAAQIAAHACHPQAES